jgi:hypothetical protein
MVVVVGKEREGDWGGEVKGKGKGADSRERQQEIFAFYSSLSR